MDRQKRRYWGYAIAILATGALILLRWSLLDDLVGEQFPFVLFMASVVAAASMGGLKPGMLAVALGLAAGIHFYTEHQGFYFPEVFDRVRLVSFILVGGIVSVLTESLQSTQLRLERRQKQLEAQEERLAIETQMRQQVEKALEEREERFRMAVEAADIGTWDLDLVTGESRWSERSRAIFGLEPNEDASRIRLLDLVHADDRDRVDRATQAALDVNGNGSIEIDCRARWPDGTIRWVVVKGQAFFLGAANPRRALRFIGTVLDITDRKALEESLKEADRRKDEFLATLAHELRNPIVPLKNALRIASSITNDSHEARQMRAIMDRQVQQLTRLIDDLLDVARITQGKFDLQKRRIDLAIVVSGAVETIQPLVKEAQHRLSISLPSQPIIIHADLARLTQVFSNILHNAVKYSGTHGVIEVKAQTHGDTASVAIRDNGIGIPHDMLSDIFETFRQIDTRPNRLHSGLGIGLNLAKCIALMHGGNIEARSDGIGRGSELIVTLPTVHCDDSPSVPPRSQLRSGGVPRRRVLVVDDVQASAETLAVILRTRGQDVSVAFDGLSAIEAVLTHRPEVVLLDIGMPGIDGYEVARRLRAHTELRDLVLVALTGYGNVEARRLAIEAGFDHHVIKTADIEDLEQVLLCRPN